jgi:hypothetical protein
MIINLNDYCEVILSKTGALHLNTINQEANVSILRGSTVKLHVNYKEGDTFKSPLWALMETFSVLMKLGGEMPFRNAELTVLNQ